MRLILLEYLGNEIPGNPTILLVHEPFSFATDVLRLIHRHRW